MHSMLLYHKKTQNMKMSVGKRTKCTFTHMNNEMSQILHINSKRKPLNMHDCLDWNHNRYIYMCVHSVCSSTLIISLSARITEYSLSVHSYESIFMISTISIDSFDFNRFLTFFFLYSHSNGSNKRQNESKKKQRKKHELKTPNN